MRTESEELTQLHSRLRSLEEECRKIGQFPPRPDTLRATAGAWLVSIVRRTLFWYTPPVRNSIEGLAQITEAVIRRAAEMESRLREQADAFQYDRQHGADALEEERRRTTDLESRLQEQADILWRERQRTAALESRLQEQADAFWEEHQHAAGLERRLEGQLDALQQDRQRATDLESRVQGQADHLQQARRHIAALESRLEEQSGALEQERQHAAGLEGRLQEQAGALEQDRQRIAALEGRLQEQAGALEQERQLAVGLAGRFQEQMDALQQDHLHIAGLENRLQEQASVLEQDHLHIAGLENRLSGVSGCPLLLECPRIAGLEGRLQEQAGSLEQAHQRAAGLESRLSGTNGCPLLPECQRVAGLEGRLQEQAGSLDHAHQRATGLENRFQEHLSASDNRLREELEALRQERARIQEMLQQERLCSIELENRLREQVDAFEQLHEDRVSRETDFAGRLQKTDERLHLLKIEVLDQSRRISRLLEEARKRLPAASDTGPLRAFEQEAMHDLDSLYLSFEDEFRGTQEEVRRRLNGYLPFLREAQAAVRDFAVLDVGCGRGEWLELLRQEGFQARGVDSNRLMIETCRERQLQAEEADALEYLGRLPDASVGGVTVFHMVEHLPFRKLIRLLDEVVRVLQPGGVALFETPNPDNILVGARNFYYDPTHHNPIPSATLRFLVEARGLCQVKALPLNPCDPCNHVPDQEGNPLAQRFNEYFYGPQDYAVVGRKV